MHDETDNWLNNLPKSHSEELAGLQFELRPYRLSVVATAIGISDFLKISSSKSDLFLTCNFFRGKEKQPHVLRLSW